MKASLRVGKLYGQEHSYARPLALNLLLAVLAAIGAAACFLGVAGAQTATPGAAPAAKAPAAKARGNSASRGGSHKG